MKSLGKLPGFVVVVVVVVVVFLLAVGGATAADTTTSGRTGAALQRALSSQFDVIAWPAGSSLGQALRRLADLQGVAIMLDRRIDPGAPVEFSAREITLAQVLGQLAGQAGAVPSYIGGVVYIGPRADTSGLARVAEQRHDEARRMPRTVVSRLLAERRWGWAELAEPRDLIRELGVEAGVTVEGLDQVPHDLWPALDLPPLSWTDRLTLVLAGFGLTFELADRGASIQLVALPRPSLLLRTYPVTLSQPNLDAIVAQFHHAEIERTADSITLQGTAEEHERLQKLLARSVRDTRPSRSGDRAKRGTTVHTLRVQQQPVGAILKTLEQQLQLRFQFDSDVSEQLQTRVSFDVREVPLEQLLDETLAPAGLTHRADGDVIRIGRK